MNPSIDLNHENDFSTAQQNKSGKDTSYQDDKSWLLNLPALLRTFGTAAILISLYTFLMRGWEGSSDVIRYCMLLGHTGLLTVIAIASGHILKEGKGARILMMLSLISSVVNFAILGAFIFSSSGDTTAFHYPGYVTWSVDSLTTAIVTTSMAMLVLIPVIWLGFRTLTRGVSQRMSIVFLMSNLALLIPLRDSFMVAIMAIILTLFSLFITRQTSRERIEVKTFEGKFAIFMQFLPVTVLLGRSLWLYSPDISLLAAMSGMIFIAFRQAAMLISRKSIFRTALESCSVILAILTGIFVGHDLSMAGFSDALVLLTISLISAGLCYEISTRSQGNGSSYRVIAMLLVTIGLISHQFIFGGLLASILTLSTGIALLMFSYALQQKALFSSGIILILTSLIEQSLHFFQYFDFGYWASFAIAGVVAIVLGSALETKGYLLKQYLGKWRKHYSEWQY